MKIKEEIDLSILIDKYKFEKINKEDLDDEDWVLQSFEYLYNIGHARRGQFYYLLIDDSRSVIIYASNPDGSGGTIALPDILLTLFKDEIIE